MDVEYRFPDIETYVVINLLICSHFFFFFFFEFGFRIKYRLTLALTISVMFF